MIGSVLLAEGLASAGQEWAPPSEPAREYAQRALRSQRFTSERLTFPIGADLCGAGPHLGYRRVVGSELSDAWYDASQMLADAAMARLGQTSRTCALRKTVRFLGLVARPRAAGYYPRADVDGANVTTRDTYSDDNALIGLALLEARESLTDQQSRGELLRGAASAASFLREESVWDDTFGGGIWWNTNRGQTAEGKPAQTTAMAAQLFVRLYQETGESRYAVWAQACLDWLDGQLLDPSTGLYRYNVRHWDLPGQTGQYVEPRLFSYDQGIMIEVHLLFEHSISPGVGHLPRARALAEALQRTFWDGERGGYHLEAGQPSVYTAYSAWVAQSLLALHVADRDPTWLRYARANLDALETHLRDPADGGYFPMQYRCQRLEEPGCEHGNAWSYDPRKLLFSQAWMQRANALLAARLAE